MSWTVPSLSSSRSARESTTIDQAPCYSPSQPSKLAREPGCWHTITTPQFLVVEAEARMQIECVLVRQALNTQILD